MTAYSLKINNKKACHVTLVFLETRKEVGQGQFYFFLKVLFLKFIFLIFFIYSNLKKQLNNENKKKLNKLIRKIRKKCSVWFQS
jgi:hypothetical protein